LGSRDAAHPRFQFPFSVFAAPLLFSGPNDMRHSIKTDFAPPKGLGLRIYFRKNEIYPIFLGNLRPVFLLPSIGRIISATEETTAGQ
jgi:hypothetical protein